MKNIEDKYFQDECTFNEEKGYGELIENQYFNQLSEEYIDIINATLRYNSLKKEYNNLNKTVNRNKYINDFVKGLNPPIILFEENKVVAVTILPKNTTLCEEYLTGLKRVFKKNNINIRNINPSFFHPLIYRFNNKHNHIEWELAYLIYEDIPSKKKLNKYNLKCFFVDKNAYSIENITYFRKMRSTFRQKRNIKIFLLSFIFLLVLGSSFCLNSISNIIQDTQSFNFFLIIKFMINGILVLLPLAFLSISILYILGVLRIFQTFELANSIEEGDSYYIINKLLIYFIILASVLMIIFNYFSYFNFNYFRLFELI